MTDIIDIKSFRAKKRRMWIARYHLLLDQEIDEFLSKSRNIDVAQMSASYQGICYDLGQISWGYEDLRESMFKAMDALVTTELYELLKKRPWFDATLISKDQIVEYCLNRFISAA